MSDNEEAPRPEPVFNLPPAVFYLVAAQTLVFLICVIGGATVFNWIIFYLGFLPERYARGPSGAPFGLLGLIWPFFTHLFVHGGVMHLLFNSLWLMAMGTPLARRMGTWTFLAFYFSCGVGAALAHLGLHFGEAIPVVGASGAVSGCMGGAIRLMFAPTARYFIVSGVSLGRPASLFDRRVLTFSVVWLGLNYVFGTGLLPMPGAEGQAIAWEAHVGGYVTGLLLFSVFDRFSYGYRTMFEGFREPPHR